MPKIEIDGDTADRIVVCSIKEAIKHLKEEIKHFKRSKRLSDWEKKQLAEDLIDLDALEKVYNYYGGNI